MSDLKQHDVGNRLLRNLSSEDFDLLAPGLERRPAESRDCLSRADERIAHVYFPEQGLASITLEADPCEIEVGLVGREGFVGLPVLLGGESCANHAFVQMPGTFLRLDSSAFRRATGSSPTLTALLLRYVQAYLLQVSCTATANAGFSVEQRLARWLLMAHDRAETDDLALTHEFLAMMLGVRRPGVTVATHVLEGEHMIRAKRGHITVLDRAKLETFAKGSYGRPEAEYERLIGPATSAGQAIDRRMPVPERKPAETADMRQRA